MVKGVLLKRNLRQNQSGKEDLGKQRDTGLNLCLKLQRRMQ